MGKSKYEADVDTLKKQAAQLSKVLGDHAQALAEKAGEVARDTSDWAEPHVDAAWTKISPKVKDAQKYLSHKADKTWRESVKFAAPKIESGSRAVRPAIDTAHDKVVGDYLPRLEHAMQAANKAAMSQKSAGKAGKATQKALAEPTKKRRGKKVLAWIAVSAAAAGAGYYLWKRTQPTEDPWAEEYWQNADDQPASFTDKAAGATHAVQDKAKEFAGKANGYAKDLADAVKGSVEDASARIEEFADDTAAKAEDVIDEAEDTRN